MDIHAHEFLAFAGNGTGEIIAFDAVGTVFMLPLIGMEAEQAVKVANSFSEFADAFGLDAE